MAILLLLIVIGSLLYWRANEVVEHSVEHTNSAMLGQLRELADGQLQMIEQLEQQIANHPKLSQADEQQVARCPTGAIRHDRDGQRFETL